MGLPTCLSARCVFETVNRYSDLIHPLLSALFQGSVNIPNNTYVCQEHGTVHICGSKDQCWPDSLGQCRVSRLIHGTPFRDTRRSVLRESKPEPTSEWNTYRFVEFIMNSIKKSEYDMLGGTRMNSLLQRLYELFMEYKEQDDENIQLSLATRKSNMKWRMKQIVDVFHQELTHVVQYQNSDPDSQFRTRVAFLISTDRQCDEEYLMPFSSAYAQHTPTRVEHIVSQRWN